MNDLYTPSPSSSTENPLVESLAERMDLSIGEASTVMGSVITELMRRALRGGVMQIGDQLNGFVGEKVDATIAERTHVIEQTAADVADKTARNAATEVVKEEVQVVSQKADQIGERLTAQIADSAQAARQATAETARDLCGKIELAEKKAELGAASVTMELTTRLKETEQRAIETARADAVQQLEEYREKSRQGVVLMKARIKRGEANLAALTRRLEEEQTQRQSVEEQFHQEIIRRCEATQ